MTMAGRIAGMRHRRHFSGGQRHPTGYRQASAMVMHWGGAIKGNVLMARAKNMSFWAAT
jgi:hypothetical protein